MKIELFIYNIILAIITTGIVVIISQILHQRRWTDLIACLFSLALVFVIIQIPLSPIQLNTEIKLNVIFYFLFIGFFIILVVLYCKDSDRRRRNILLKWFGKEIKSKTGWEYNSFTQQDLKKNSGSLSFSHFPVFGFDQNYSANSLTDLKANEDLSKQISVYHIVDEKNYISWVDASYWATLRHLSSIGISVKIYFNKKSVSNKHFFKYAKAIAGHRVTIDEEIYDRFTVMHENNTIGDNKSQTTTELYTQNSGKENTDKYVKLTTFARLLPMLIGCRHIWVLIWEKYYSIHFKDVSDSLSEDIHFKTSPKNNIHTCFSLNDFKTVFLVCPTAIGIDDNGNSFSLLPAETFLLGEGISQDIYEKIKVLPNASLKCISKEIFYPLLSPAEKIMFCLAFNFAIIFRKDRKVNEKLVGKDRITKTIAQIFNRTNHVIYYKVCKDA